MGKVIFGLICHGHMPPLGGPMAHPTKLGCSVPCRIIYFTESITLFIGRARRRQYKPVRAQLYSFLLLHAWSLKTNVGKTHSNSPWFQLSPTRIDRLILTNERGDPIFLRYAACLWLTALARGKKKIWLFARSLLNARRQFFLLTQIFLPPHSNSPRSKRHCNSQVCGFDNLNNRHVPTHQDPESVFLLLRLRPSTGCLDWGLR